MSEVLEDQSFLDFIKSYRCRVCKQSITEDNFGGLGPNHMIGCIDCLKKFPDIFFV